MKKLLLTTMIAALLVVPFQGVALAGQTETSVPYAPTAAAVQELPEEVHVHGSVPAETGVLESMTPALHAMVLAGLNREGSSFDYSDEGLCWEALYNMLSLYGQMDERAEYDGEELVLPAEIATDFAAAFFPGALDELPQELADRMTYDAGSDSYHLVCGSDSLAQIQLNEPQEEGDALVLTGCLVYLVEGTDLAQFRATLVPRDNLFGFAITELELL